MRRRISEGPDANYSHNWVQALSFAVHKHIIRNKNIAFSYVQSIEINNCTCILFFIDEFNDLEDGNDVDNGNDHFHHPFI